MKKFLLIAFVFLTGFYAVSAQSIHGNRDKNWKENYRSTPEKFFNLRHTKLKVSFDLPKRQLFGEAWITLRPHFYPQETLILDAKAMDIKELKLGEKSLVYKNDGAKLNITLDKTYTRNDSLTLYIKYVANPEKVAQKGSAAISSAKGLYFIDPDYSDPDKPTQIWTQGETEASSCWFPTIDAPNQKTTQEIYITVPDKFVTLSNGTLESQNKNADGTRTDYWKFMMPHAPYLFYMGVGEFAVVKDTWKNIAVDYYVEKEFEPYAKGIFGLTPEMIEFFSAKTGVVYPWPKYAQMICRDYVSGAMENTTAVIHAETANQNDKQLADENVWEDVIAHELFHHWFGDYVTCESWSNLSVNESFATYSEYLWREYKYGRDHADALLLSDDQAYLNPENTSKDLIRFYYADKEDMFDAVSYQKGGHILHMLRYELGDDAFFAGLQRYLEDNKFGTGEAHQLRLALEEVSGRDLNPFFNQWYFGSGHPKLDVKSEYDAMSREIRLSITQTQGAKLFNFPLTVDVYTATGKKSFPIRVTKASETFIFKSEQSPLLVNADADRVILCEINENKTTEQYIYQLGNAPRYLDKIQALDKLYEVQKEKGVREALAKALNDPYFGIREDILVNADFSDKPFYKLAIPSLESIAKSDKNNIVRGLAISLLAEHGNKEYVPIFREALNVKSYSVMAGGLKGLYANDKKEALAYVKTLNEKPGENEFSYELTEIYIKEKDPSGLSFVAGVAFNYFFMDEGKDQELLEKGYNWVVESDDEPSNKVLVDNLMNLGIQYQQYGITPFMASEITKISAVKEKMLQKNPSSASLKAQIEHARSAAAKLNAL